MESIFLNITNVYCEKQLLNVLAFISKRSQQVKNLD